MAQFSRFFYTLRIITMHFSFNRSKKVRDVDIFNTSAKLSIFLAYHKFFNRIRLLHTLPLYPGLNPPVWPHTVPLLNSSSWSLGISPSETQGVSLEEFFHPGTMAPVHIQAHVLIAMSVAIAFSCLTQLKTVGYHQELDLSWHQFTQCLYAKILIILTPSSCTYGSHCPLLLINCLPS